MAEIELPGGFVNVVVGVGDTVRRTRPPNAAFVQRLLAHLEDRRWPGAPRFLGVDAAGKVRAIADAYGLSDTSTLVDTVLWWQDRCWRGIEAQASAGVEAAVRLRALGHVTAIRDQYIWTAEQRPVLDEALSR